MSDDLNGVFDHLDPADFDQATSAIHAAHPAGDVPVDPYERFVTEQLNCVRYAFAAADGAINPVATLASSSIQRIYAPEDDESLGQYVHRLAREARIIQAHWLFISRKTEVGTFRTATPVAVDDPQALRAARAEGDLVEAVYWYAERLDATPRRRHGYLTIVGNHLGELVEHPSPQIVNIFAAILGGVAGADAP